MKHFDAEHYFNIGIYGYTLDFEYAFFPLFPIIISFFNLLKIPIIGTILFNILISYLTTILIFKISKDIYKYEDKTVKNIIMFWLFSPVTLFTIVPYTESLFIFLTVLVLYIYKLNKYPIILGITLGLSVLTRSVGAMLFFALFIVLFIDLCKNYKTSFKSKFIYIIKCYIPATLISIIYPIFLYFEKEDLFYFITIQFTEWCRVKSNIFSMIYKDIDMIINNETTVWVSILNFILLFTALFFTAYFFLKAIKNKENDNLLLNIYTLLALISFFSTMRVDNGTMASCSIYRYLFSLFPIYIYKKENCLLYNSQFVFVVFNFIIIGFFCLNLFLC